MPIPLNDGVRRRAHAVVSSMSAHRIFLYAVASLAAVSIAILNAMRNYSNFYSIAIYLSKSSRSVLVCYPQILAIVLSDPDRSWQTSVFF